MGCSEGGKQAAVAAAVVVVAAAAGVVGSGPLHAGIAGRADRVGAAPLACCWYPKQLPNTGQRKPAGVTKRPISSLMRREVKFTTTFISSDRRVITQINFPNQSKVFFTWNSNFI